MNFDFSVVCGVCNFKLILVFTPSLKNLDCWTDCKFSTELLAFPITGEFPKWSRAYMTVKGLMLSLLLWFYAPSNKNALPFIFWPLHCWPDLETYDPSRLISCILLCAPVCFSNVPACLLSVFGSTSFFECCLGLLAVLRLELRSILKHYLINWSPLPFKVQWYQIVTFRSVQCHPGLT